MPFLSANYILLFLVCCAKYCVAIIAILHCLSPLSDCLIVCTVQRVLIQQVKREEEFATCSNEKM